MPHAPVLTVYNDAIPCPRVEVSFPTLAAGTDTVTVYRIAEARTFRQRAAVTALAAGSFARVDYEVPFGITSTYRAEMFDAAGVSLGFTDSTDVIVNCTDSWMHNPLNPAGALLVDVDHRSGMQISRPIAGEVHYPRGRSVGVLIAGRRRGVVGLELMLSTDTAVEGTALDAMFGGYDDRTIPIVCLRTPPGLPIPRTLYASVLSPTQRPINAVTGGKLTEWDLTVDEVAPPAPALIVPLLKRSDINAFFATKLLVNTGNLTRDAVNRRYDLAGTT